MFRTLPIPVPEYFFQQAQSTIDRYLWSGKKARCAFNKLIKPKQMGGIGHTSIKDYHVATILAQMKDWFPSHNNTLWTEQERSQIKGGNLYNYLITSPHHLPKSSTIAPTIQASIEAWQYLLEYITPEGPQTILKFPITALEYIIPDISLTNWCTSKALFLEDLFVGPKLKIFRTLQIEYSIPASEYYKYVQLSHLLEKQGNNLSTHLPWQIAIFLYSHKLKTQR